jgi:hypothetical protein
MLCGAPGASRRRTLKICEIPAAFTAENSEDGKPMRRQVFAIGLFVAGSIACVGPLVSPRLARAQEAKPAARKESWKPEDFIYQESVGQYRISPDAKGLVWVKSAGDKDKDARVSNLFLSGLSETRETQLTRGSDTNTQPRWSPDGERIAFLSTRARPKPKPEADHTQIWLIDARGGEPWALTELAHAPKRIEWLDKDTLIYSAQEDPALYVL